MTTVKLTVFLTILWLSKRF